MTTIRFILLFLALVGIFISGSLFFRKPKLRNRSISIFIALFSFQILDFLYSTSEVVIIFPQFFGLYLFPSGFLYGPLFYVHILSFSGKKQLQWKDFLHLIPSILLVVLLRDVFSIGDGIERQQLMRERFIPRFLYYNYAIAVHVLIYAVAILYQLRKYFKTLQPSERIYIVALSTIYISSTLMLFLYVAFANSWRDFSPYYLTISIYFLIIGFLLYTNPKFLTDFSKKYLSSNLSEEEMRKIVSKLRTHFEGSEIFLKRNVTISEIADELKLPAYKISQSLSTYSKTNFNDFLNEYRIKYSEALLVHPDFQHYKVEAIALESGFNNKVTFYKAFTKVHGTTPTSFRSKNPITGGLKVKKN